MRPYDFSYHFIIILIYYFDTDINATGEEQGYDDKHLCFAQSCRRKFGTKSALDNHIVGRHLKQWQNKCIGCNMDFSCMNSKRRYQHRCLCIESKYPYIDKLRKII